jgi:hypothetical protein
MIRNGLYSVVVRAQDGVDDGDTGVVLLRNGEMLGGSSHFYWSGTYACADGKCKGELTTQEHIPVRTPRLMAGRVGSVRFSGTYTDTEVIMSLTALVGNLSIRYDAMLHLLKPD